MPPGMMRTSMSEGAVAKVCVGRIVWENEGLPAVIWAACWVDTGERVEARV